MGYFGSVRFFKNLILLAVIVMIAIPTGFAIHLNTRLRSTEQILVEQRKMPLWYSTPDSASNLEVNLPQAAGKWTNPDTVQSESPYADLYPDFYAPQELTANLRETGVLYLTFDDGPSASTPEILSVLKEKNVRATFFVVTQGGETDISLMKQMVAEGHTLAMHSYTHDCDKIYESVESFLEDYYQLFHLIQDEVGITPTIFRFPGGSLNSYNQETYQEIIAEMLRRGFVFYDWNLAACDAVPVPPDKEEIVSNILEPAVDKKRGFVLMHDSAANHSTVEALPEIIDGLRGQGFVLAPLNRSVRPVYFYYS